MARRSASQLYVVTGPGIEDVSYADPGPALSRTLTAALAATEEGTWYARNAITDETYGYTVREGNETTRDGVLITTHRPKGRK